MEGNIAQLTMITRKLCTENKIIDLDEVAEMENKTSHLSQPDDNSLKQLNNGDKQRLEESEIVIQETEQESEVLKIQESNKDHLRKDEKNPDNTFELETEHSSVINLQELNRLHELSPKKMITKPISLSSPPDRKLTNNSSSPVLRPKTTHLTGRGAQLINMIRNKRTDSLLSGSTASPMSKLLIKEQKIDSLSSPSLTQMLAGEPTTYQSKDLLVFSKRLPSPTASPSASILKRKLHNDSIDDICIESPAYKRKRVSFHDPPVSVTKEFLKDTEENKTKPKRCLMLEKINSSDSKLKRRSKIESLNEMKNLAPTSSTTQTEEDQLNSTVKFVDANKISTSSDQLSSKNNNIHVINPDEALNVVVQQFPLESILEKYFSTETVSPLKAANTLAKYVSDCMSSNAKIKTNVLEILSENHSKDFLDHAIQENLSSVVCDRLNLNSVIDYICAKSKINTSCRNNLMSQILSFYNHSKLEAERFNFIKDLLGQNSFHDKHILDLISILIQMRSGCDEKSVGLCESAVDSSSNL